MYLEHFKLKELPFRLGADPRFHFLGVDQEMVKSQLRQGLVDCDGCMLLTGESGVGKTMLIDDLLPGLPDHYRVVHIKLPEISASEFYRAALLQLGEPAQADQRGALMGEFETCLERHAAARRIVAVMLDSGELASTDLVQELYRLARRSAGSVGNLRIVLIGRPALENSLAQACAPRPAVAALHVMLGPFEGKDVRRYLSHRIEIAGGDARQLLEEDCYAEFQRYTGGVPRLLNTLADAAMVVAFNRNRTRVSASDIRAAVDQLQWVEFHARPPHAANVGQPPVEVLPVEPMSGLIRIDREGRRLVEFELPVGKISLGRAKNNDVRIDSQFISRHHCHILTTRQYSVIEDLQSQNGILVGGRRVSVHRLRDGDTVSIGDHSLTYSKVEGAPAEDAGLRFPMVLPAEEKGLEATRTRLLSIVGGRASSAPK